MRRLVTPKFQTLPAVLIAAAIITGPAAAMEAKDRPGHSAHFSFGHAADAQSATQTVVISIEGLKFRPEALHVKAGEIVHFVITNTGDTDHEFTLGDQALQQAHRQHMAAMAGMTMHHHGANSVSLKPHETKDLTWAFGHPGLVEFDCDIPGHYEAGMKGTINVD